MTDLDNIDTPYIIDTAELAELLDTPAHVIANALPAKQGEA